MKKIEIKICGLRREIDIRIVNEYLPEYAGFVFAEGKRKIQPYYAEALIEDLDSRIKSVGVFVNEKADAITDIVCKCKLGVVQLHGDETQEEIELLRASFFRRNVYGIEIWKAIRVHCKTSLDKLSGYNVDAFVLDGFSNNAYGGTGKNFDWNIAEGLGCHSRIGLAGGLHAGNVLSAAGVVKPFMVDTSSGVETDGWKDRQKIEAFISAVRSLKNKRQGEIEQDGNSKYNW